MPRSYSLNRKKDFDLLFSKGARRYSRNFSITFLPSNELKFAFIVSKKNVKKASHRNYTRRIMREIVRKNFLTTRKTLYVSIISKTDLKELAKKVGFVSVQNELINLLRQVI